jgi:hypothetical protein
MSLSSGMGLRGAIKRHSKLEDLFEKKHHFYTAGLENNQ